MADDEVPKSVEFRTEPLALSAAKKVLEAISKKGFWFKIAAAARFKPEEYFRISRI